MSEKLKQAIENRTQDVVSQINLLSEQELHMFENQIALLEKYKDTSASINFSSIPFLANASTPDEILDATQSKIETIGDAVTKISENFSEFIKKIVHSYFYQETGGAELTPKLLLHNFYVQPMNKPMYVMCNEALKVADRDAYSSQSGISGEQEIYQQAIFAGGITINSKKCEDDGGCNIKYSPAPLKILLDMATRSLIEKADYMTEEYSYYVKHRHQAEYIGVNIYEQIAKKAFGKLYSYVGYNKQQDFDEICKGVYAIEELSRNLKSAHKEIKDSVSKYSENQNTVLATTQEHEKINSILLDLQSTEDAILQDIFS